MKRHLPGIVALTVVAAAAQCYSADIPVFSGPQPGERLNGFKVLGVYDEYKGKELDFVEMAEGKPFLLIFVHRPSRPSADLTRTLMHYGETRLDNGLFVATVMLGPDVTESERHMKQSESFWKNGPPAGVSLDGEEGPGYYGLNRNVEMTVLVGRDKKVSANFPLVQPSVTDAPKILAEVNKFIGGEVPTTPELDMLKLHSRVARTEIRLWQDGKPPRDPQLRELVCAVLHAGDDTQAAKSAAAAVEAYVGTDEQKRKELGNVSQLLLAYRYGSAEPIIAAIPSQREFFETWAEQYFTPEYPDIKERRR